MDDEGKASVSATNRRAETPESLDSYDERLRTPWWWYPVAIFAASLLAAEFRIGGYHITVWLPFSTMLPLAALIVWSMGRVRVQVHDRTLFAGPHQLPLSRVTGIIGLDEKTTRRVIGREGDPAAVLATRAWIGPSVQLWLDDDPEGVPYWLVSTRHPSRLMAVVRAHQR